MPVIEISDLSQPELEVYTRLTEAQLRSKRHAEQGVFIAESAKVITHALDAGVEPLSLLMEHRQLAGQGRELLERCPAVPVYTAERELLERLTGYALSRGVLCAMRRPAPRQAEALCRDARRVAVLENISDAANVGALLRSAAALGVDAVLLTPSCCDPLLRRCVRVSMGTVFQVPWARLESWPEEGLRLLHGAGFKTAAMALSRSAVSIEDEALSAEPRLAMVLGSEGDGLTAETVAACDYTVCIPMSHGVDSLNVAAAGAVAFWALRAR